MAWKDGYSSIGDTQQTKCAYRECQAIEALFRTPRELSNVKAIFVALGIEGVERHVAKCWSLPTPRASASRGHATLAAPQPQTSAVCTTTKTKCCRATARVRNISWSASSNRSDDPRFTPVCTLTLCNRRLPLTLNSDHCRLFPAAMRSEDEVLVTGKIVWLHD